MKEKVIILFILCSVVAPAMAIQTSYSNGSPVGSVQEGKPVKIYNQYGSHIRTFKKKSNGEVREYNSTGSFKGRYKERAGKVIYFPKN